eukprot:46005_1
MNPMIINIAIACYENEPNEPEFDGYVRDIYGVETDIETLQKLFKETLKYSTSQATIFEINGYVKLHLTKKEIVEFLTEKAILLQQNILHGAVKYDGLIVTYSG